MATRPKAATDPNVDPVDGEPAVAVIDGEPMSLARWGAWLGTHPTDPAPDAEQEK